MHTDNQTLGTLKFLRVLMVSHEVSPVPLYDIYDLAAVSWAVSWPGWLATAPAPPWRGRSWRPAWRWCPTVCRGRGRCYPPCPARSTPRLHSRASWGCSAPPTPSSPGPAPALYLQHQAARGGHTGPAKKGKTISSSYEYLLAAM